ncbi:sigma-70 family RNA polymerase sigma factor [Halobacillus rhizosphaerae]|uniref:RNA polymerase sigma factor n=1 Tax=Halobacillus rhizosphaerae TaxID=3064889 RepID=UPI00398B7DBE
MKKDYQSFQTYHPYIYFALNRLRMPRPYDDFIQESYFIYLQCIQQFNPALSKFSTYFTHHLIHHFRTLQRNDTNRHQQFKQFENHCCTISYQPDLINEQSVFYDVFHHCDLNRLEADIVKLSLEEHTIEEIALLKEISASTVKRARKRIKKKIERLLLPNG